MLYIEREGLERPYSELYGPGPGIPPDQATSAQFGFRRASLMVDEVLRLWARYYQANLLARALRRVRQRSLEAPDEPVTQEIKKNVAYQLRTKFQYDVSDSAELISDVKRGEEYGANLERRLGRRQSTQEDGDETSPPANHRE